MAILDVLDFLENGSADFFYGRFFNAWTIFYLDVTLECYQDPEYMTNSCFDGGFKNIKS